MTDVSREPVLVGLQRGARGIYPCGLCGVLARLTRTHVPPHAAGNRMEVRRASLRSGQGGAELGRASMGGLWGRGLCERCNSLAGARLASAYADFAHRLLPLVR